MNFEDFNKQIQAQFANMCKTGKLFRADVSGDDIWDLYLRSFEVKRMFRDPDSTENNCNCCKNFIRRYGNVVSVNDLGQLETMFTGISEVGEYTKPAQAIDALIKSKKIVNVFFETYDMLNTGLNYESCNENQNSYKLGILSNLKKYTQAEADAFSSVTGSTKIDTNKVYKFSHFCVDLPKQFVDFTGKSVGDITGKYNDKYVTFSRAMKEISLDTLVLVRDLINQGSLLDGTSHLHLVEKYIEFKKAFNETKIDKDVYCWVETYSMSEGVSRFRGTVVGSLCIELTEGKDINDACKSFNYKVDPVNYHKATAPITKKQIEEAEKFVVDNGYVESFSRRLATINDIKASEILHINSGDGKIKDVSIFDNIKPTSTQHKRSQFDNIEEVSIEKFMKDILPSCTSVEAFVENRMEGNFVALTTANQKDSKPIFKWNNNYSWTFNGNLAGKSQLRDAVVAKGGRVDGVFRFTHSWNELEPNQSLMDLHVFMPGNEHRSDDIVHESYGNGRRVGWNHRIDHTSGGRQDVDYTEAAPKGYVPVENITFPSLDKMPDGKYICKIHNWSFRKTGGKGKAEIEFGGNIYQYEYPETKHHEWITVAEVTLKDGEFSIDHKLPETNSSKELWGLETNSFHKVNLVCLSPNHWDDNKAGNLHYMFMLENCKADTALRGFHNENLIPELLKHRKVMEVLGSKSLIEPSSKHLAGLGFNSTVKDSVILKCNGNFKRTIKVSFKN